MITSVTIEITHSYLHYVNNYKTIERPLPITLVAKYVSGLDIRQFPGKNQDVRVNT